LPLSQADPVDGLVDAGAVNVRPVSVQTGAAVNHIIADQHSMLFVHAPSEVVLPVANGERRFEGGCAFIEGAYTSGRTDGAEFSIEALTKGGRWEELWRRTLDPLNDLNDRGFQRFAVEVPVGASQVRLRIAPGENNQANWDWTCWGDLRLLP
ncbi:MAG TPA: hypothetical protein VEA63_15030, partial [Opitutus sp.]|nr:hypothetical protein [Opitutus sp.]